MTIVNQNLPHNHGERNIEEIIDHIPNEELMEKVSSAMRQLGDPSRLRIFWLLCHTDECVINIASIVNMSSPAVSHHLRLLKASGLIVSQRQGKEMYYKAKDCLLVKQLHRTIENVASISCDDFNICLLYTSDAADE